MTATLDPATIEGLTDKQREVLELHNDGKSPTEIGKALGITSQAVHGHFRRLRASGLLPDTGAAKPAAAAKRPSRPAVPNGRQTFDPGSAITAVKLAAAQQRRELDAREQQIDGEIDALKAEKKAIGEARRELNKLVPPEEV
jgi:hypothetical protein